MPSYKGDIKKRQCRIAVWIIPAEVDRDPKKRYPWDRYQFVALIDTGAQKTCVSKNVVDTLGLVSKGKERMQSATEKVSVNKYSVDIAIPITDHKPTPTRDGKIAYTQVLFVNKWSSLPVMELKSAGDHDVLLGMDILRSCNFFMAHGQFVLSY